MAEQLKILDKYPIRTRLSLNGTLIVARDIAHAKLQERIDSGDGLPQYFKDHPVYYAGPAKTPQVNPPVDFIAIDICVFGLMLYFPVNSYGHVMTVSLPNHTFYLGKLY